MREFVSESSAIIRNCYGVTSLVSFGLATELGRLSDMLVKGAVLCAAISLVSEGVHDLTRTDE
ncbi:MAG: hypothetical protein H6799_03570 [Candidatus Nomurabacteria bacterium]|nr:MAG: hypothetical protein H6799_03570 [Candidatus Nomurabacteria bacterium]HRV76301.1 hypothetical protein [Candidatus Saccharimonadales bacterium]